MAAESPRKGTKYLCNVIRPHPFSDKSVAESVFDFISDVVPQVSQAYSSSSTKTEDKEKIVWIRFEQSDINDLQSNPNLQGIDQKVVPLLIVLGYVDGVQIWQVMHNGEAVEVMSLRQGPVSCLRVLPTPCPDTDDYKLKRPLVAVVDSSSAGNQFCGVKFVSLKTADEVKSNSFRSSVIHNIECNKRFIVIVFQEKLAVFDACRLKQLQWITGCYPCPGPKINPIALGDRWLAYADKRLLPVHQSCGGMSGDGSQSYAATVISAAKGAFKGLTMFGEAMVSSVTGSKPATVVKKPDPSPPDENGFRPGIVSVYDLKSARSEQGSKSEISQFYVSEDPDVEGLIAHFHAHANEPVAAMAFDPSGILLVTACKLGHNFHVFSLVAHPCSSSLGAVHHLYTLHRGDTTAKVVDIAFTNDSRWVTVSTHRGTTHVFPITPYGGTICARTHCQARVVNRVSRFHKSAGLDEIEPGAAGRHSPILSSSPGTSGPQESYPTLIRQNALRNNTGNPRLPPYPHPTPVAPLAQLKQTLSIPGLGPPTGSSPRPKSPTHSTSAHDNVFAVCATFSTQRLWTATIDRRDHLKKTAVDSLFILNQNGCLSEYHLEPRPRQHAGPEKHLDDSPIELEVKGLIQWNLQRSLSSQEVKPPLASNNPLIVACEAVQTQQASYSAETSEPGPVTRYGSKDSLSSDQGTYGSKEDLDEQWVSQVEIITHVGPHRRLWMGPQFSFKTYQNPQTTTILSSSSSSLFSGSPEMSAHVTTMDILTDDCDLESLKLHPSRSSPVAMPTTRPAYRRSSTSDRTTSPGRSANAAPVYIEAGSYEQSPILSDVFSEWTESNILRQPRGSEEEEDRLRKQMEEAMIESPAQEGGPNNMRLTEDVFHDSSENLSSSGSSITTIPTKGAAEIHTDNRYSGGSDSPDLLG
ncbi:BCAS3 microtubule associated cell migration factor-like [Physella acuta]|uniref:BCAS3 microtubule associated cell migration factor-like n=1 Tax=Physella acuta TaxID=109671 RepID=UPI0027DC9168|nr:BCAS3 microtubule associated cell migration factor-like [Physella acuta]